MAKLSLTNGCVDKKKRRRCQTCAIHFLLKFQKQLLLYISTQTKIGFLNQKIPLLKNIFWKYTRHSNIIYLRLGIVKKQMKIVCM